MELFLKYCKQHVQPSCHLHALLGPFELVMTERNESIVIYITDPFLVFRKVRQYWAATDQKPIRYRSRFEVMNCTTTSSHRLDVKGKVHQSKCPLGWGGGGWRYANSNLTRPASNGCGVTLSPPGFRFTVGIYTAPTRISASIWNCLFFRRREA